MLKRPRVLSPSPTRPDPSSPPPLDNNVYLPLPKRRRTAGPIIDSNLRRDWHAADDGEDDYEEREDGGTSLDMDTLHDVSQRGNVYEHVNQFLHGLHTEHQHRSRPTPPHTSFKTSPFVHPHPQHPHARATFLSPRADAPPSSSPAPSPTKHDRELQADLSSMQLREQKESQESDQGVSYSSDRFAYTDLDDVPDVPYKGFKNDVQDEERLRVTHRYEDTNRLLGSLVLGRRRTLVSPTTEEREYA